MQKPRIFYVRVPFRINTFEFHSVKMTRVLSKKKQTNQQKDVSNTVWLVLFY